jgi:hypothetical protein
MTKQGLCFTGIVTLMFGQGFRAIVDHDALPRGTV